MSQPVTMQNQTLSGNSNAANILTVGSGQIDLSQPYTELRMPNGQVVRFETALLTQQLSTSIGSTAIYEQASPSLGSSASGEIAIPLIEEQLTVGKRTVTTGKVLLQKTVQEHQQAIDERLAVRTFDIERITLNQVVETAPDIRQEGDTTVYSLVEEQLVLMKQLVLKEEVRVTKRDTERHDTQVVTLRREQMVVEREPVEQS